MSDTMKGPDWWLASDGKWYPPDLREAAAEGLQRPEGSDRPVAPDWWLAADGKWYPPALRSAAATPESREAWLAMRYLGFVPEQNTEASVRGDLLTPLEVPLADPSPAFSAPADSPVSSFSSHSDGSPSESAAAPVGVPEWAAPPKRKSLSVEDLLGEPAARPAPDPTPAPAAFPASDPVPSFPSASVTDRADGPPAAVPQVLPASVPEVPPAFAPDIPPAVPEVPPADRGWSLVRSSDSGGPDGSAPAGPPPVVTSTAPPVPAPATTPTGPEPDAGWFDLPPESQTPASETARRSRGPRHGRRRRWLGLG